MCIMFCSCYGSEKIKMATKIKDEYGMILKDHIPSKKEEQAKQKKTSEPLELNPYGVPTQCKFSSYVLSAQHDCIEVPQWVLLCYEAGV